MPSLEGSAQRVTVYDPNLYNQPCEIPHKPTPAGRAPKVKDWTFITYMAADNDLAPFARKNLSQQAAIGSSDNINIVVHLDTRIPGNRKITKRYFVEKDKLMIMMQEESKPMNSGDPKTLIDCCKWAIQNYPARNYALILWNHGTGIIDISRPRAINPSDLFSFNPTNNLIELNRTIPFLEFIEMKTRENQRGICFDDTTAQYITNQGLEQALKTICTDYLGGKKFSIIGFDACLMAMLEVNNILKDYADYAVGSQEVELGTGWRYDLVLEPFLSQTMDKRLFAQHIVHSYENAYNKITNDYTQSAVYLAHMDELEEGIHAVAILLNDCLKLQIGNTVRDAIRTSRHKLLCTHFDEPSYIDLHHVLTNIQGNLERFTLRDSSSQMRIVNELRTSIQNIFTIIQKMVIANTAGKNLNKAKGISIYFPERRLHPSYPKTKFAAHNRWFTLLNNYLGML